MPPEPHPSDLSVEDVLPIFRDDRIFRVKDTEFTAADRAACMQMATAVEHAEVLVAYVIRSDEDDPQALRDLMDRILRAVGSAPEQADLIELSDRVVTLQDIRPEPYRYVLSFGAHPLRLGLQVDLAGTMYRPFTLGATSFIWSHALHRLATDVERKKQLWTALQAVFQPEGA